MAESIKEAGNTKQETEAEEQGDLRDLSIEIVGTDAFDVAASLNLVGLAIKRVRYGQHTTRDSAVMERALRKIGK